MSTVEEATKCVQELNGIVGHLFSSAHEQITDSAFNRSLMAVVFVLTTL